MSRDAERDQYCRTLDRTAESEKLQSFSTVMKTVTHTCLPDCDDVSSESIEEITESVDELREKLAHMRKLMEARNVSSLDKLNTGLPRKSDTIIIDGSFLSWIFGVVLALILSVSFYAFYNLYIAVMKRFPPYHTEL